MVRHQPGPVEPPPNAPRRKNGQPRLRQSHPRNFRPVRRRVRKPVLQTQGEGHGLPEADETTRRR